MRKLSGESSWLNLMKERKTKNGATLHENLTIGVLTFEVSTHMSKAVHLWHSLSEQQITKLRDEFLRLEGVRKLVSNDDTFLLGLSIAETMDSVDSLSRSVSSLGKRCSDPALQRFDQVFADLVTNDSDLCGFLYSGKKMERKVRKLEGFVAAGAGLYHELVVLGEMEQGLRKMEIINSEKSFFDLKQKVVWQRQAVRGLREVSVWNRSYDYTTRLLARSLFTIAERLKLVFGFASGSVEKYDQIDRRRGALIRSPTRIKWLVSSRSFKGWMVGGGSRSHVLDGDFSRRSSGDGIEGDESELPVNVFNTNLFPGVLKTRRKLLNAPPSTLGAAALALHYANVIIVIEKLAASPHLIGDDARDDLYGMLPMSIRMALRIRLKSYAKNLSLSVYDPELAADWTDAIGKILEWLSPLAHNMIKWQSDRNFEQHHLVSSTNVLLLQTLYYANQGKTEAAITELLVGLNYLWRYAKELNEKTILECAGGRNFDHCLDKKSMVCGVGKTK